MEFISVKDAQYVITCDVAGGLRASQNTKTKPKLDYTVVDVWNRLDGRKAHQLIPEDR